MKSLIKPLSRVKTSDGLRVRGMSPVGKEKVHGGKDLQKSQVLSSEWNTERIREDASGDSEDGEDDELPWCHYIGESARDCVWRCVHCVQNLFAQKQWRSQTFLTGGGEAASICSIPSCPPPAQLPYQVGPIKNRDVWTAARHCPQHASKK